MADQPPSAPVLLPLVFGNCAAYLACGVIASQGAAYWQRHTKDSVYLRASILTILALNLSLLVVGLSRETKVVAYGFGDLKNLISFHERPEDILVSISSLLITLSCQLFLATRSYLFTRALYGRDRTVFQQAFTVVKVVAILVSFSLGCVMTAELFKFANYAEVNMYNNVRFLGSQRYPLFEMLWVVFTAIADLLICISMSLDLHRAKTGNRDSNTLLQTLINLSLRNGILLLLTALVSALLYFLAGAGWTDATLLFLPRLGTITVLSSINSPKEAFRAQQRRDEGRGINLSNTSGTGSSSRCVCGRCTCQGRLSAVSRIRSRVSKAAPKGCRSTSAFDDDAALSEQRMDLESGVGGGEAEKKPSWGAATGRGLTGGKKGGAGSGRGDHGHGVTVSTTSKIEVEEGRGLDAWGNLNNVEDRIGNFVHIEGPATPASRYASSPAASEHAATLSRDAPGATATTNSRLSFIDSFPSRIGQNVSVSSGGYNPDAPSEYELPLMVTTPPDEKQETLQMGEVGDKVVSR